MRKSATQAILTGALLAFMVNFLLFRIYVSFSLEMGIQAEKARAAFMIGLGNDAFMASSFLLVLYLLALIAARLHVPAAGFRIFLQLVIWISLSLTGLLTHLALQYYLFAKSYLDADLIRNYLFQLGHFTASISSRDFSISALVIMTGLWCLLSVSALLAAKRSFLPAKKFVWIVIPLLFAGSVSHFFFRSDYHLSTNYVVDLFTGMTPLRWPERMLAKETRFDRCVKGRYTYPDPNHPLFRKEIGKAAFAPLTDLRENKPNIIFIIMESYSATFLDRNRKDPMKLTPEMERLIDGGIYFSRFYANSMQTSRGVFASLCSIYPHFGTQISTNYPDLRLSCLPSLLKPYGYESHYIQSDHLDFDNMGRSLKITGFDTISGHDEMPATIRDTPRAGWGIADEHLFRHAESLIEKLSGTPFLLTLMTLTNHHPYEVPEKAFEIYPPDSLENRFRNTLHYSDHALGHFLRRLEAKGLLKNTLVVITGDHSVVIKNNRPENITSPVEVCEELYRIPLVIYTPDYIKEPWQTDVIASQVDILPLLLSLLGIPSGPNAFVGQNPLVPGACHFAIMHKPFDEWNMVMRYGPWQYEYRMKKKRAFFDLIRGPEEIVPLPSIPDPALGEDMLAFMLKTIRTTNEAIETNRVYPPK